MFTYKLIKFGWFGVTTYQIYFNGEPLAKLKNGNLSDREVATIIRLMTAAYKLGDGTLTLGD